MVILFVPLLIVGLFFLAAVLDFVRGGGRAATQTGSNAGPLPICPVGAVARDVAEPAGEPVSASPTGCH
jgi:hypothetical protein